MELQFLILFFMLNPLAVSAETASVDELPKNISAPKVVADTEIQSRLQQIFSTSGWFPDLKVEVKEGLVFLSGKVHLESKKDWALKIIEKTEGVVAIVDNIEDSSVRVGLSPVQNELSQIRQKAERLSPYLISAVILLVLSFLLSYLIRRGLKRLLNSREVTPLIATAISNLASLILIVLGFYFALKVSGLSTLAVTVLGGTGFLGIGLGLALKGAFENYSASIMISMREIFKKGEWVKIGDHDGIVHSVTTKGTTLMDFNGNIIVIPNAQVFGSVIENYTRNPKMRAQFMIGVSISESFAAVQKTLMNALVKTNGVLQDPEPSIVISDLSTTNYKITVYFWFDAVLHSRAKIRSSVIECCVEAVKKSGYELEADSLNVTYYRGKEPLPEKKQPKQSETEADFPLHNTNSDMDHLRELANFTQPISKEEDLLNKKW